MYSSFSKMLPTVNVIKKALKCKKIKPSKARVLFVPFADTANKYYLALCRQALQNCGINKSNISTLTSHTHKSTKADIIFVSGGNVCALKDELIKIDWFTELKNRINSGTIYIGDSAGSVLLGSTIEHTLDYEPYAKPLNDYKGLGVINKGIVVHYSLHRYSGSMGLVEDIECYQAHVNQTLFLGKGNYLTIANNQVVIVKNNKLKTTIVNYKKIDKAYKKESSKYGKQFAESKTKK